ncbi:MAG: hypothetical protein ACOC0X_06365 [Halobacteriota archaeon]
MTRSLTPATVDRPSIAGTALAVLVLFAVLVAAAHPVATLALAVWTLVVLLAVRVARLLDADVRARRAGLVERWTRA